MTSLCAGALSGATRVTSETLTHLPHKVRIVA